MRDGGLRIIIGSIFWVCVIAWTLVPASSNAETQRLGDDPARVVGDHPQPVPKDLAEPELREVFGEYVPTNSGPREPADGDSATKTDPVFPFATLPVVSEALERTIANVPADELVRVIVALRHLPQDRISTEVQVRHAAERAHIERGINQILALAAARRDPTLPRDADNLADLIVTFPQEREDLKPLNEQLEALGLVIKNEMTAELTADLAPFIERVRSEIERLGGDFEFSAIAGSLVVARVPAARIAELASHQDILRVSEDRLVHSYLNLMDDATLVNAPGGLWDSGDDGGIYDPAVVDSGLDINHPAMRNDTSPLRDNFYSWYLVAGVGSSSFGDVISQDDVQGHGTHVSGIVGSYGSTGYSSHLGMSNGVDKMVTLKAAWYNTTTGGASMFWSDKYNLVNRALYIVGELQPSTFGDDVDGMNLSYGGATSSDDTDGSRFWDSVISTYSDLPVTISAGNSGPSNTLFSDPAVSYNAIAVANAYDHGTTSRADDTISANSTVGPTANGRKKPDLAAPGTSITAPNNDWETEADFIVKSGTSMAAPSVLGVIMDLMDAGVFDELRLKALLINTAQKNEPGINIESDSDGWHPQIGWGYMNALAAYTHRYDIFTPSLTPRDTSGDYQLYAGVMRDEGPTGEGRDRATMVWNRHATYNTSAPPTSYYSLVDLDLALYRESDDIFIDSDATVRDNVHQVRVASGTPATDVVLKAYAYSTVFSHGGATEGIALATEEGFAPVDLPADFSAFGVWQNSVEPGEIVDLQLRIRNNDVIASHDNTFDLGLPSGWSLTSGADVQNVGSAAGGLGFSDFATWSIQAPPAPPGGAVSVTGAFSHNSYGEPWGTTNYSVPFTVEWDTTPPTPNPMTFSTAPAHAGLTTISMWATSASDLHEPIQYYHDYSSSPTGGTGGSDSGWQFDRNFSDLGLVANNNYCYRAWARDDATTPNVATPSATTCAFTMIQTPVAPAPAATSTTIINILSQGSYNNLNQGTSGLRVDNLSNGTNSGWTQSQVNWDSTGLSTNTQYSFATRSRNGDGLEAPIGPTASAYSNIESSVATSTTPTSTTNINTQSQGSYSNLALGSSGLRVDNLTQGTNSGWMQTQVNWGSSGLAANTQYDFATRSRNGDGSEAPIGPSVSTYTLIEAALAPIMSPTSTTSLDVQSQGSYSNLGLGSSGLRVDNLTNGANSGWTAGPVNWSSAGLAPNTEYGFNTRSRNGDGFENPAGPTASAFTMIEAPVAPTPTPTSSTSIDVQSHGSFSNLASGGSGLRLDNLTDGTNSGWMPGHVNWTSPGLIPNTEYTFTCRSRNGDGFENPPGPTAAVFTFAAEPAPAFFGTLTHISLTARWSANGNPAGTEFWVENVTTGVNSGWTTDTEWIDTSTGPEMTYSYQGWARNAAGVETTVVSLGNVESPFWGDGFESGDTSAWSDTSP